MASTATTTTTTTPFADVDVSEILKTKFDALRMALKRQRGEMCEAFYGPIYCWLTRMLFGLTTGRRFTHASSGRTTFQEQELLRKIGRLCEYEASWCEPSLVDDEPMISPEKYARFLTACQEDRVQYNDLHSRVRVSILVKNEDTTFRIEPIADIDLETTIAI
jgi:hypothetical protein